MSCWVYEGMLLFAVVFIAGWLFSTLGQMRDAMDARRPLLQAFLFVVFGIYFSWFWSRGQTLAMKTWNIRVVDRAGRQVSQLRALWRYVLCLVPAATGRAARFSFHRRRSGCGDARLGCGVGGSQPLPPAAPVLA
jgi:uncharacterized RDD family membrane protein YckC